MQVQFLFTPLCVTDGISNYIHGMTSDTSLENLEMMSCQEIYEKSEKFQIIILVMENVIDNFKFTTTRMFTSIAIIA